MGTRSEIVRLAHRGLGVGEFSLAAARALRRAVPFDGVCVATMDPATLLVTGHTIENGLPDSVQPRYAEIEVVEDDFNKFTDLVRAATPAASLSAATGGKLDRSLRHRELRRPNGFGGDELRAALGNWGGIVLLRETGRADFTPADVATVAALSRPFAEGLRRALLFDALADEPSDDVPGLHPARPGQLAREGERGRRGVAGRVRRRRFPPAIRIVAEHARAGDGRAVDGAPKDAVGALADRARLDARRPRGGDPGGAARTRAGAADRRPVRAHGARAGGDAAGRPGPVHERDRAIGCSSRRTRCRTT